MKRLALILLLGGCAQGPEQDLPSIKQARSAAAEWALVSDQAAQGKLTRPYANAMREAAREQLKTSLSSLSDPTSPQGREISAILAEPANASSRRLHAHVAALERLEHAFEPA